MRVTAQPVRPHRRNRDTIVNAERLAHDRFDDVFAVDNDLERVTDNLFRQPVNSFTNVWGDAYFHEWTIGNDELLSPIVKLASTRLDPTNRADGDIDAFGRMH